MKNPIKKLEIKNFKTAKNVSLDCKRINIIIGKPNVGKSNILEAISLLGGTYSINTRKYFSEFIRYEKFEDLFYDKQIANDIIVRSDIGICIINYSWERDTFKYLISSSKSGIDNLIKSIDNNRFSPSWNEIKGFQALLPDYFQYVGSEGNVNGWIPIEKWYTSVKKYDFKKYEDIKNRYHQFLIPPSGTNLFAVVFNNKKFFSEISDFFKEYKLKFTVKPNTTEFSLLKSVKGVTIEYQYSLIADTLQRIIFYLMAIGSNKESILILEEPETHSFPRYTKLLAEKIISSKQNQFFISTHSPFILNTIIENASLDEVAVFVASYENFQTKVKPLSKRELEDMLNYGNDIFFSDKLNG